MGKIGKTVVQLLEDLIWGGVTTVIYFVISNQLDKVINHFTSNLIGLIINYTLNFLGATYIFTGKLKKNEKFFTKYFTVVLLAIIVSQLCFMLIVSYSQRNGKHWEKKHMLFIRWISGAIAYLFVDFPLTKWWVFKKK
jgi:putative flippase GtrA